MGDLFDAGEDFFLESTAAARPSVTLYRVRRKSDGLYYQSGWSYTGHWKKAPKFLTRAGLAQVRSSLKENEPRTRYVVETWNAAWQGEEG